MFYLLKIRTADGNSFPEKLGPFSCANARDNMAMRIHRTSPSVILVALGVENNKVLVHGYSREWLETSPELEVY